MKKTLFQISVFLCVCLFAHAQHDTIWLNSTKLPTTKDHATFYQITEPLSNQTCIQKVYTLSHQMISSTTFSSLSATIKEGLFSSYDTLGFIMMSGNYHRGFKEGIWQSYFPYSSRLASIDSFFENEKNCHRTIFDSLTGKILMQGNTDHAQHKHGKWITYYPSTSGIHWEHYYINGIKENVQTEYFKNMHIKRRELYFNGKLKDASMWDSSGKKVNYYPAMIYPKTNLAPYKILSKKVPCYTSTIANNPVRLLCHISKEGIPKNIIALDTTNTCIPLIIDELKLMKWQPAKKENIPTDCSFMLTLRAYGNSD